MSIELSYGVMVTQQSLDLFFLVRVQVAQQKRVSNFDALFYLMLYCNLSESYASLRFRLTSHLTITTNIPVKIRFNSSDSSDIANSGPPKP